MSHSSNEMLIRNATLWPSVDSEILENGSVLIREGKIAKVGHFHARADTVIDVHGALVMPGFVQGHIHFCQTLFRGLAEDVPLLPWLREYIWPLEAAHDEDSMRVSVLLGCAELIRSGVTAFLSLESTRLTQIVFETVHEVGLMGTISHCFMDESSGYAPLAIELDDFLADCDLILDRWGKHPHLSLAVAPRFALSATGENLQEVVEYARQFNLLLHTHANEQLPEIEAVKQRTGYSNIEWLHRVGLTGPDVALAHCVHTSEAERAILRETGTRVLHCPTANLKLGSGIAPIPEYLTMGIPVALGSDGAPCNNRLDIFAEMRTAALIQKIRKGPDALAAREVVRMATEGGAVALGRENEIGILAEGYRANIVVIELTQPHILPVRDIATTLVYSCTPADVVMTIVNGRILYENGQWTTIDIDEVRRDCDAALKRVVRRAGISS